jgi:hypothetical protein
VARDEAKAKKQDDEEQEKHMQAEREYRHRLLLQRAGHKEPSQEGEGAQTADGLLASIFDCKEEDSKAEHPENVVRHTSIILASLGAVQVSSLASFGTCSTGSGISSSRDVTRQSWRGWRRLSDGC